jgi:predicted ester cyclase
MTTENNKWLTREVLERGFNQGDLSVFDEFIDPNGVDHQEPPGTPFVEHLKQVVTAMRTAFPDLHFEIHDILGEGEIVAFRSTMTGTHSGLFTLAPGRPIPPTGRHVSVPHMHFVRVVDGKTTDLWHLWNIPMMMQQMGVMPQGQGQPA